MSPSNHSEAAYVRFSRHPPRPLRDPRPDRRWRDGRGVSGARRAPAPRRCSQGAAVVVLRRSRSTAALRREARAASALNHPNILTIHDIGTHEGAPYLVSELLEGESLRDRLSREGRSRSGNAIDIVVQIAQGLAAAHEQGIVHRDLKPENLFVLRDGRVKILDFGLAKLTRPEPACRMRARAPTSPAETEPGVVMGTRLHVARAVAGPARRPRADIFSLGAILYEMLAGRRAFSRSTPVDTMSADSQGRASSNLRNGRRPVARSRTDRAAVSGEGP